MTEDELDPVRLERLLAEAAQLPREAEPPVGAWQAIRARIDSQRVLPITAGADRRPVRHAVRWWPVTAAAILLLAVGLSFALRGRSKAALPSMVEVPMTPLPAPAAPDLPDSQGTVRAMTAIPASLSASNPALAASIDQYQAAARELEAAVSERTAALSPQTREVVRRSLATIDTAIADLRAALGHTPTDARVGQSLSAVYEQKLDFLKRVRALPAAGM